MAKYLVDLLGGHEKLIMDPVHGGIALFSHETKVIDHPLFQRLRNICQNDILSLVFPGYSLTLLTQHWGYARWYAHDELNDKRLPA